jgi:hypothetical protein
MGRIDTMKMAILPKVQIQWIPIKILNSIFKEIGKSILKFIWKHKRSQIAKAILSQKSNAWRFHNSWLKIILQSYGNENSMVMAEKNKTKQNNQKQEDHWNRIQDPE